MRVARLAVLLLLLLALPTMFAFRAGAEDRHSRVTEYGEGHAYCPPRALIIGAMIVPAGRCYKLGVLRDNRGAFLAFLDPGVRIHSGERERLDSDEGRGVRGQILFLVPMQMTGQIALLPVNTIQLIRLREVDEEGDRGEEGDQEGDHHDGDHRAHSGRGKLVVIIPNAPTPNVEVTIVVSF